MPTKINDAIKQLCKTGIYSDMQYNPYLFSIYLHLRVVVPLKKLAKM